MLWPLPASPEILRRLPGSMAPRPSPAGPDRCFPGAVACDQTTGPRERCKGPRHHRNLPPRRLSPSLPHRCPRRFMLPLRSTASRNCSETTPQTRVSPSTIPSRAGLCQSRLVLFTCSECCGCGQLGQTSVPVWSLHEGQDDLRNGHF